MRRSLPPLLLLLLLAPSAQAAERPMPHVRDASGDAWPAAANLWADLDQAWVEPADGGTYLVHLSLARLDAAPPMSRYVVVFERWGMTQYVLLDLEVREARFLLGQFDEKALRARSETPVEGHLGAGAPAHLWWRLPPGLVDGMPRDLRAYALERATERENETQEFPPTVLDAMGALPSPLASEGTEPVRAVPALTLPSGAWAVLFAVLTRRRR